MDKIRTITLKAGLQDPLDFQKEHLLAKEAIELGYDLSFEIDLGLFSKLKKPLLNKTQFLSLELSLEHFKNTLWVEFHEKIKEICLYTGDLDFSADFQIDESLMNNLQGWALERFLNVEIFFEETHIQIQDFSEITPELLSTTKEGKFVKSLFCRDVALDYLHMLRANLPDAMPLCMKLDETSVSDPLQKAILTHRELYEPFLLTTSFFQGQVAKHKIAICLPNPKNVLLTKYLPLKEALDYLIQNNEPYRLIPESMLISEWDLVDYLFVLPHLLESQGKRKLQGFAAAGGVVVTLGDMVGVDNEISFNDFRHI